MTLDRDGNERLKIVLEHANGDAARVRSGVTLALHGVRDRARRIYLRRSLTLSALAKIRKNKNERQKPMGIKLTPELLRDAKSHELRNANSD